MFTSTSALAVSGSQICLTMQPFTNTSFQIWLGPPLGICSVSCSKWKHFPNHAALLVPVSDKNLTSTEGVEIPPDFLPLITNIFSLQLLWQGDWASRPRRGKTNTARPRPALWFGKSWHHFGTDRFLDGFQLNWPRTKLGRKLTLYHFDSQNCLQL